jgi:rhodanese-related sulfurtransferase
MKHLHHKETWDLLQSQPGILFLDVRMEIESLYVGRPPGVILIPWYEFPGMKPDPERFVQAVEKEAKSKDQTVVLICRSGVRTVDAGRVLEKAGFTDVINVLDGFEGERDDEGRRSTLSGWRFDGLPWTQT